MDYQFQSLNNDNLKTCWNTISKTSFETDQDIVYAYISEVV